MIITKSVCKAVDLLRDVLGVISRLTDLFSNSYPWSLRFPEQTSAFLNKMVLLKSHISASLIHGIHK